ncbi:MAG: GntR family transcriptional regulator [Burkholderiaceae bacterium]|nr:GntR family transcriptional regulator [Burkholderiaceae bacterium]
MSPAPTDADIHARLAEALLDQRLAPGQRLREDELGQAFGVSRTRIRQVLIRLASEELVTLVPNAGARVAEPTPDEAREVFGVRRLLEPELLASFVVHSTAADLRALQRWIREEERARSEARRHDAIRHAGAFHLHIADHAGNRTLARLLRPLVLRTSLVLLRYGPQEILDGRDGGCNCQEHRTILAALKLRDAAAAGRAMLSHLSRLEAQLQFQPEPRPAPRLAMLLGLAEESPV